MIGALLALALACVIPGTVTDADTGKPIAGAKVFAKPHGVTSHASILTLTGEQGAFCFDRLDLGQYEVIAARTGYISTVAGPLLTIGEQTEVSPISVKLARAAAIGGIVLGADGEPREGPRVTLYRRTWDHGWSPDQDNYMDTDDRGAFRFGQLASGMYFLSVRPSSGNEIAYLDDKGQPIRNAETLTWFRGALTFPQATPIRLEAGQQLTNLVVTIDKVPQRRLSGRLAPALQREDGHVIQLSSDATTPRDIIIVGPDHSFSVEGLLAAKYRISLHGTDNRLSEPVEVDLTNGDVDGFVVDLVPALDVKISVRGVPGHVQLVAREVDTGAQRWYMDESGIQLNGSGPFNINNSTFDYAGNRVAMTTSTLFTLNNVQQSTITLTDVTYGGNGPSANDYSYTISGSSTGLFWTNQQYSGAETGDSSERNDTSNLIRWAPVGCSTFTSLVSGSALPWSSTSTWDSGLVPTQCNPVVIPVGSTVTVDIGAAVASTTTISGQLSFSRVVSSTLTIVGGTITINSGGWLDMGTQASPINASSATLILPYGQTPEQYGLVNSGALTMYGSTKTPWSLYQGGTTINTGTSSLQVADATGWQVGDTLIIDTDVVKINGAVAGGNVPITSPALTHYSSYPIVVSNLSRNVVVRSSGTDQVNNVAYIENLSNSATTFVLAYAELAYIGSTSGHGIWLNKGQQTFISSCSIHDGYGVFNNNGGWNGNYQLIGNVLFNDSGGVYFASSRNRLISNVFAACGAIMNSGSNNSVLSNYAFFSSENPATNIGFSYGQFNVAAFNTAHDAKDGTGRGYGIRFDHGSKNNVLTDNLLYNNGNGLQFSNSGAAVTNNTIIADTIFGNVKGGIASLSATGNLCAACRIGYSTAAVSTPDSVAEISFDNTVNSFILKGSSVNSAPGIPASNFSQPGSYLINYSTSVAIAQIYGDYQVAGSTLTLDYASQIYASTATTPMVMWGNETASNFTVVWTSDTYAVSQLITLTATDATHWQVAGSSTPGTVSIAAGSSGNWPAASPQLNISIQNITASVGDTVNFGLIAASQDLNQQKKLYVGPSSSTFNNGRSKITIAPSGGFVLKGAPAGAPYSSIDMLPGGTYYTFVDSGAFTVSHSSISNMDESGIQLSGPGPFSINDSTFDYMGSGVGSTSTLITLNGVQQSTITLNNVTYGSSGAATYKYNYTLAGSNTGLFWTNTNYSGALAGYANEWNDPNNQIIWAGAAQSVLYWIAETPGNWNNPNLWSLTSRGPPAATVPQSNTSAIFDGGGPGDCAIDVAVAISSLTVSTSVTGGYAGTVDTSSNSVTLSSFTMNNGAFYARTSTVTLNGPFTLGGGTFNAGASSMTLQGFATLPGSAFIQGSGTRLYLFGDASLAGTFTKDAGAGTVTIKGDIALDAQGQNLGKVVITP